MTDLTHLDAIRDRLHRERERLASASTVKERAFRAVQVTQAEKELTSEMRFLGLDAQPTECDMSDDDLLAELLA